MRWEDVAYRADPEKPSAVRALEGAVASLFVNGGCEIRLFQAVDRHEFTSAWRHDLNGLSHVFASFLQRPEVRAALSGIQLSTAARVPPDHRTMGAFEMEGALTQLLLRGGAYQPGLADEEVARSLSRGCLESMLADRRLSATVFCAAGAWTAWFRDVAWDHSFVVCDHEGCSWWTLFATDTD